MPTAYAAGRRWIDTVDPTQGTTFYGRVKVTPADLWTNTATRAVWIAIDDAGTWVHIRPGDRVYEVGSGVEYATIADAITAVNADGTPTATSRAVILLMPGTHDIAAQITLPAETILQGLSRRGCRITVSHSSDGILCGGDGCGFANFTVAGPTTAGVHFINGNDKNRVFVESVDMWNNGGNAKAGFLVQEGASWSVLNIEDVRIDFYDTSASEGVIVLSDQTTVGAARVVDAWMEKVWIDLFQLTSAGNGIRLRGVQDVRMHSIRLRGPATASTFTGLLLGNGATVTSGCSALLTRAQCEGWRSTFNGATTTLTVRQSHIPGWGTGGTVVHKGITV